MDCASTAGRNSCAPSSLSSTIGRAGADARMSIANLVTPAPSISDVRPASDNPHNSSSNQAHATTAPAESTAKTLSTLSSIRSAWTGTASWVSDREDGGYPRMRVTLEHGAQPWASGPHHYHSLFVSREARPPCTRTLPVPGSFRPPLLPNSPTASTDSASASGSDREREFTPRTPRAPRPSYSEEQKFFIMFTRIVKDLSWPELERAFDQHFGERTGPRTKGGLTSVYYRIRRGWGLDEVLKGNEESKTCDKVEVEMRASNFSPTFLNSIGYFCEGSG